MSRKKKHEEHENLERWLVSYADFITLLFAFFVVMYALSSVNEGKFRVLSASLVQAFNPSSYTSKQIEIGPNLITSKTIKEPIEEIAALKEALRELEKAGKVNIFQDKRGVVVRIVDTALYDSGMAELIPEAVETIDRLAAILGPMPNAIRVEGHTDDIPIHTPVFPSNWELSAGRAISIVKEFTLKGIDPMRQEAVGFGEYRPIGSNTTPEGRGQNRRVDIVILNPAASAGSGSKDINPFSQIPIGP